MMEKRLRYLINIIIVVTLLISEDFQDYQVSRKNFANLMKYYFLSLISDLVVQHSLIFFDVRCFGGYKVFGLLHGLDSIEQISYETVGVRNNLSPQISLKMYVR